MIENTNPPSVVKVSPHFPQRISKDTTSPKFGTAYAINATTSVCSARRPTRFPSDTNAPVSRLFLTTSHLLLASPLFASNTSLIGGP